VTDSVKLADDTFVPIREYYQLTFTISDRTFTHDFDVMPALGGEMLIGVDVWSQLGFALPPAPRDICKTATRTAAVSGGIVPRTSEEDRQLEAFLRRELIRFETVTGPTTKIEHRLRLTDTTPIKQRYRPRNPAMQAIIDREVDAMKDGIIERS